MMRKTSRARFFTIVFPVVLFIAGISATCSVNGAAAQDGQIAQRADASGVLALARLQK